MKEEDRLIELLDRHCELQKLLEACLEASDTYARGQENALREQINQIGNELFSLIEAHFRQVILPVLVMEIGREVSAKDRDTTLRFTNALGDFFRKVLDKRHDDFWRAESRRSLVRWSTRVIINDMKDLRRKRGTREKHKTGIGLLYEAREKHFNQRYDVAFEESFPLLAEWDSSCNPDEMQMAQIIRYLYVIGMSKKEICTQMRIKTHKLNKLLDRAMVRLRRKEEGEA